MPIHFSIGFVVTPKRATDWVCAQECDIITVDAVDNSTIEIIAVMPDKKKGSCE